MHDRPYPDLHDEGGRHKLVSLLHPTDLPLLTHCSWKHVLPTSIMIVAGVTIVYCCCTLILLASVPNNVKSLCGGMVGFINYSND